MKRKRIKQLGRVVLVIVTLLAFLYANDGCTFNNEEDLHGCDTLLVTYTASVVPILENNCYKCHGIDVYAISGGGNLLQGYDNLVLYVNSGLLSGVINHKSGFLQMPRDARKLSECEIARIEIWIREGTGNN